MYKIKEIFYTLQGEGFHTGKPAVFCRFSGCNLWTGREEDRDKAICKFCDTDFWGMDGKNGGKYSAKDLTEKIRSLWPDHREPVFVVCTGGEPGLQIDKELVDALHQANATIAIETNGTVTLPEGIDWVCVSPKANTTLEITKGNELKLVYPQVENKPDLFEHLDFQYFFLQPMDDERQQDHIQETVAYCMAHPKWTLSLQTHKILGIE